MAQGVSVTAAAATDVGTGASAPFRKQDFESLRSLQPSERALAVFVIDNSSAVNAAARRATLPRVREAVLAAYDRVGSRVDAAVIFYGETANTVIGSMATREDMEKAVAALSFTDQATRTYAAIDDAIDLLESRGGVRRQILLFTDGEAEDGGIKDDVLERAIARNVEISPLVIHWRATGLPARGATDSEYELLAERTRGVFGAFGPEAGAEAGARGYLADLEKQARNGGIFVFDSLEADARLTVDMVATSASGLDRTPPSLEAIVAAPPAPTPEPAPAAPEPDVAPAPPPAPEPEWWESERALPVALVAAAAAAGILIAALLAIRARRRKRQEAWQADADATEVVDGVAPPSSDPNAPTEWANGAPARANGAPAGAPVLARIQFSNGAADFAVTGPKISIGRASENDLVLDDSSVSRYHGELHRTREGQFAITDLDSYNRTLVNGSAVDTRALADGDRIRMGAVELTFRAGAN